MIRTSMWFVTLALAAALLPTPAKADTTYAVDETVGAGSATGFITTNGTIGTLDVADIVNWNLTLNDGTNSPVDLEGPASGNNSLVLLVGSDLTATPTQLIFAFGAADGGRLQFYVIGGPVICYSTIVDCTGTIGVSLDTLTPDTHFVFTALSDTEAIAGPVLAPEPATVILLPAGIALLLLMRKRFARPFRMTTT
ncbi:MAG TPA: PEP-CTERM sorting domain-containing protein [Candidatus Dormibacteraeota bacterium]|nr:PEP-CTERM sorting domain-containing protein [Candidatus Dormibacteraeota bacterium]